MRVFWGHSNFPYYLSGTIVRQDSTDRQSSIKYETKEYPGMLIEPLFILSDKKGKQLKKQLAILKNQREEELDKVNKKYMRKLELVIKVYKND